MNATQAECGRRPDVEPIRLETPLSDRDVERLNAGDAVLLSGVIFTARDAAHARMASLLREGKPLPIDLAGQAIYYVGPTPPRPGRVIGSAGPTTSYRMDAYTPLLLEHGLKATIGKGQRSHEVVEAMKRCKAVYFAGLGGAGALMAASVLSCEVVAYEDLGTEAIRRLVVKDMPLYVVNDVRGNDLYVMGRAGFLAGSDSRRSAHEGEVTGR